MKTKGKNTIFEIGKTRDKVRQRDVGNTMYTYYIIYTMYRLYDIITIWMKKR